MSERSIDDDGYPSRSSRAQAEVERNLQRVHVKRVLKRTALLDFLFDGLVSLPSHYVMLDASQPWLCYWLLHSLALMNSASLPGAQRTAAVQTLRRCQHPSGGYGGGPGHSPHLATTYAAVCALCTLGGDDALSSIDRDSLRRFLLRMKRPNGGFSVTDDGEIDARGVYLALAVASLCNLLDDEKLSAGCVAFIASLQSYDGGFGGEAGNESHGGYTYCALAAASLLARRSGRGLNELVDVGGAQRWVAARQMSLEGGFQGRPNKLVDSCYSFWLGASFRLLSGARPECKLDFARDRLQEYIVSFCQAAGGGLRDKPGKSADYYHTCYALSGLALCHQNESGPALPDAFDSPWQPPPLDVCYNLTVPEVERAQRFFAGERSSHTRGEQPEEVRC